MDTPEKYPLLKGMGIGTVVSAILAALLHEWFVILLAVWFLILMSGVMNIQARNYFTWGIEIGAFLGLSTVLAEILWGPWNL